MRKIIYLTTLFLFYILSFLFFSCQQAANETKQEVTQIKYIVPIWKGSLSSAPRNPEAGWAYYNTTLKKSFINDGNSWQIMAQDGADGLSIIWKGECPSAPSNPEKNWAYYNTIDGNSYIFNGYSWDYLAKSGRDGASGILLWLGSYDSNPSNPSNGWAYYNTTDGISYIYSYGKWEILSKDGNSIIWKGASTTHPSSPEINWAYFNTTTQTSYIWNGSSWNTMATSAGGNTTVTVSINWLGTFDAAPMNPSIGNAYYNSTTGASYIFDGSVWQQISKDGESGTDGSNGISTTVTGYLINWKGSFSSTPSNPKAGWAYYNSTDKKSYIYDGSSWQVMAQDGTDGTNGGSSGTSGYSYLYVLCYTNEGNYTQSLNQPIPEVNFGITGLYSSSKTTTFYIGKQSSAKETLLLTGNPPIQISGTDADCFTVIQPSITEINSGSYITDAAIIFTPNSLGEKTATITIPNNSEDYPNFSFTVKGTGAYWPKSFDGGEGDGNDVITCCAEDSEGNLYFVGYGFELVNDHSGYDWWIKKIDKNGVEDITNWNKKISYYDDYKSSSSASMDYPQYIIIDNTNAITIASAYNILHFSSSGQLLWDKDYSTKIIKGIYNNKKTSEIYIKTDKFIERVSEEGIIEYSVEKTGSITFDYNGSLVIYSGATYDLISTNGSIYLTNTINDFVSETAKPNISGTVIEGYVSKLSYQLWEFDVVKDKSYTVYVYDDCDVKSSMYYKSGASIFSNIDSMSSTPQTFTATANTKVILKVQPYSNSGEGRYTFQISTSADTSIPCIINYHPTIVTIGFDSDNNYYIGATVNGLFDFYSRKDVVLKKYNSEGIEDITNWNKTYDWGHCENESPDKIYFDGTNIIVVGSGKDLINGSTGDDTWVKIFSKDGTPINSYELDLASGKIISIDSTNLYFVGVNSFYDRTIIECSKSGDILKTFGVNYYGQSLVKNPLYLISKYDGSIYEAGYGSNLISNKSGYDWQIIKCR